MDLDRVRNMVELCLAAAGERSRVALGPIHLLKYLYLADAAYAGVHGASFSRVDWRFHKFGPWSADLYGQLDEVAAGIGAERHPFTYDLEDGVRESVRWSLYERSRDAAWCRFPIEVRATLKHAVRDYGADTPALLRYVYATPPMLAAAPGELLPLERGLHPSPSARRTARLVKLTPNEKRAQDKLRSEFQKRREAARAHRPKRISPVVCYDDVFEKGTAWLNALAGPEGPKTFDACVDGAAWKSSGRGDVEE